jgi:heme-degrading monooxygenase HmoA
VTVRVRRAGLYSDLMIARMWRGRVETRRAAEYVAYIEGTGMAEYRATPGNVDAQMWTRDLGDGRTEVVTVSWWTDLESIKGFAGDDISRAVFYAADDDFLVERETTVSHFTVAGR